jgi:SAM-dependent methyltransferase
MHLLEGGAIREKGKTVLDIGCGGKPKGDVNVDLFPDDRTQYCNKWDPRKVPNFILCDALHLPFRDNSFDYIIASHVLEHMPYPLDCLREWKRVAKERVTISIPSEFSLDETRTHLYTWNSKTFKNLLLLVFPRVYVRYSNSFHESVFPKSLQGLSNALFGRIGISSELNAICLVIN